MELRTKPIKILRINTKQRDASRKSVKALVYNLITEGEYKGWYLVNQLVPPEGIKMSVWTKEQEAYLDKRFLPLERDVKVLKEDVKVLKEDMKEVKTRLSSLELGMKEVKTRLYSLESGMKEVLEILRKK